MKKIISILLLFFISYSSGVDASDSKISSVSHPSPEKWYRSDIVKFGWEAVDYADYYLWSITPKNTSVDLARKGRVTLDRAVITGPLRDGEYMIHVAAQKGNELVPMPRFGVKIDTETKLPALNISTNDGKKVIFLSEGMSESKYVHNKVDSLRLRWDFANSTEQSGYAELYAVVSDEPLNRIPANSRNLLRQVRTVIDTSVNLKVDSFAEPKNVVIPTQGDSVRLFYVLYGIPKLSQGGKNALYFFKAPGTYFYSGSDATQGYDLLNRQRSVGKLAGIPNADLRAKNLLSFANYNTLDAAWTDWMQTNGYDLIATLVSPDGHSAMFARIIKIQRISDKKAYLSGVKSGTNILNVVAVDGLGNRSKITHYPLNIDANPPKPVNDLVIDKESDGDLRLSWGMASDSESGVDFYRIYRSTRKGILGIQINQDGERPRFDIVSTDLILLEYTDLSRLNGGNIIDELEYFYTVRPVDKLGNENVSGGNLQVGSKPQVVAPPSFVYGSTGINAIPNTPTIDDEVSLRLTAELPSTNARIRGIKTTVSREAILVDVETDWIGDVGATVIVPVDTTIFLGLLTAGTKDVLFKVNGDVVNKYFFDINPAFSTGSTEVHSGPLPEGPISIDFDDADGDQEVRGSKDGSPGKEYLLQLNIKDSPDINGWNTLLVFDPNSVEFVANSFTASSFIPGIISLTDDSKVGRVGLGGTVLGTSESGSGDGSLGTIKIRLTDEFSDKTELQLVEVMLKLTDGSRQKTNVLHSVTITDEIELLGDGDGNGVVDFNDFFLFADAFGGSDPLFDFDNSGQVDFTDFFIFADNFGKEARAKLMALANTVLGLPVDPGLIPSWPNPFNGSTHIGFTVSRDATYDLEVYNLSGQLIQVLHTGRIASGYHKFVWNGDDGSGKPVSSGVYLVLLRGGHLMDSQKITYIK